MTFDLPILFLVTVAYLLLLFLIAYAADNGWISPKVAHSLHLKAANRLTC